MFLLFRKLNQALYGNIWNRDHIERVEIVLKEEINVKGDLHSDHLEDCDSKYSLLFMPFHHTIFQVIKFVACDILAQNVIDRRKLLDQLNCWCDES